MLKSAINDTNEVQLSEDEIDTLLRWSKRPKEWSDDQRMNALMAPLRSRSLNQVHYDAKLSFWRDCIHSLIAENNLVKFRLHELESPLTRNGIKPKCLDVVIETMLAKSHLATYADFMKQTHTWRLYAYEKLVSTPLTWCKRLIVAPQKNCEKIFIVTGNLHKIADEVLAVLISQVTYESMECVVDFERFSEICLAQKRVRLDEVELVLASLEKRRKAMRAVSSTCDAKRLIKFASNPNDFVRDITESDRNFYLLRQTEANLNRQIGKLQEEIKRAEESVMHNLRLKRKIEAKASLVRQKNLEKRLQAKYGIAENIQTLIAELQNLDTSQMAFGAYRQTLSVMKEKSLRQDEVDETLAQIRHAYEDNVEVENALKDVSMIGVDFSQDELEAELRQLVEADEKKNIEDMLDKLTIDDILDDIGLPKSKKDGVPVG